MFIGDSSGGGGGGGCGVTSPPLGEGRGVPNFIYMKLAQSLRGQKAKLANKTTSEPVLTCVVFTALATGRWTWIEGRSSYQTNRRGSISSMDDDHLSELKR